MAVIDQTSAAAAQSGYLNGRVHASTHYGHIRRTVVRYNVTTTTAVTPGDVIELFYLPKQCVLAQPLCVVSSTALGASWATTQIGASVGGTWYPLHASVSLSAATEWAAAIDQSSVPAPDQALWQLLGFTDADDCPELVPISVMPGATPTVDGTLDVEFGYVID